MSYRIHRHIGFAALIAGAVALSGCQTTPTTTPPTTPPEPTLRMLHSDPLNLADTCEVNGSYFVEFTVTSDGRTGDIQTHSGPPCVQEELTAWVSSFRYEAPGQEVPSGVEWMMVTARRGS